MQKIGNVYLDMAINENPEKYEAALIANIAHNFGDQLTGEKFAEIKTTVHDKCRSIDTEPLLHSIRRKQADYKVVFPSLNPHESNNDPRMCVYLGEQMSIEESPSSPLVDIMFDQKVEGESVNAVMSYLITGQKLSQLENDIYKKLKP